MPHAELVLQALGVVGVAAVSLKMVSEAYKTLERKRETWAKRLALAKSVLGEAEGIRRWFEGDPAAHGGIADCFYPRGIVDRIQKLVESADAVGCPAGVRELALDLAGSAKALARTDADWLIRRRVTKLRAEVEWLQAETDRRDGLPPNARTLRRRARQRVREQQEEEKERREKPLPPHAVFGLPVHFPDPKARVRSGKLPGRL